MKRSEINWPDITQRMQQRGKWFMAVLRHYFTRCQGDGVTVTAGHLAYVTLLSLVPMVAISFAMFSAFPVFADLRGQIEGYVYENFVPAASDVVSKYMNDFVVNATKTTSVGIVGLVFVAFMLMSSIDRALNRIWRVTKKRRLIQSISTYWMILTMGPMLASASLAATSYLVSLNVMGEVGWLKGQVLKIFPFLMSATIFVLLFLLVPNKTIRFKHGLAGALLTAFLFEVAKRGFAVYIAKFTSYSAIYGALAAIPIIFVWVYVSWLIVLLGAELTATLGEYEPEPEKESKDA